MLGEQSVSLPHSSIPMKGQSTVYHYAVNKQSLEAVGQLRTNFGHLYGGSSTHMNREPIGRH